MIKRIFLRILLLLGLVVTVLVVNLVIFNITASKVTEGVPIENRDPERVALLVIDIQEGTTGSTAIEAAVNRGYQLSVFEETVIGEDEASMAKNETLHMFFCIEPPMC